MSHVATAHDLHPTPVAAPPPAPRPLDRLLVGTAGPRLAVGLGVLGLALALWGMSLSDESRIGRLGLIQALSPLVLVGGAMVAVAFAWRVTTCRRPGAVEWSLLLAQVFILHGTPAVVEAEPRFAVAWLHAGFVNHIADAGTLLTDYDARFSWPGFFTMAAVVVRAVGVDIMDVVRWAQVGAEAWIVVLVALVVRRLGASARTATVAAFLYASFDWIGQTYFAPQTFALLIGLVMLWLILGFLPRAQQFDGARGMVWRHFRLVPAEPVPPATVWSVLLLVVGLDAVLSASHQLTPILLVMQAFVLVVMARIRPTLLWWLFALLAVGWLVYLAGGYWSGHLQMIVGEVGDLSSVFGQAVSARVSGGSSAHTVVMAFRSALTAVMFGIALIGVLRRWKRTGRVDALVVAFAALPFLLVAMQSYGGEILLRVMLYALPFLAVAAAWAFVPGAWATRRAAVALAVVGALCVPMFVVARYGNESFERMSSSDVAGLKWAHDNLPEGSTLALMTGTMPWNFGDFQRLNYNADVLNAFLTLDPVTMYKSMQETPHREYLYVNQAQLHEIEEFYGGGPDYGAKLTKILNSASWLTVEHRTADSTLYRFVPLQAAP